MKQDADEEWHKKKLYINTERFGAGSSISAPHYSSGSLLSKICAENAAFRKNPDRIVRAVQLCWCIQGTGASLCPHSWLGRPEILPRDSNVCHNVDHFVPSEQFM